MAARVPGSALAEWRKHWPLVIATAMGMSLATVLSAVLGLLIAPMEQDLGWTRAQISSGPIIMAAIGFFGATPAGYVIDRWGPRSSGILVVVLSFISIASMSLIGDEIWQWWACWAIFGICASFTSTVWMAPVSTVFNAGRGMAIALTMAGSGISIALVPTIGEYFVQTQGWRTAFLALAIIWCVLTMPPVLAFVPGKEAMVIAAAGEAEAYAGELPGLEPREGFASPALYLLFGAAFLAAMSSIAIVFNMVPVLTFTGLPRAEAVAILGSLGVTSIIGRIGSGILMDRFEVRKLAMGAAIVSLVLPLSLLLFPGVAGASFVGVMTYGLMGGLTLNSIAYLTSTHLGARSFGLFYGIISIAITVASGAAPMLANYVYDITGSYNPVIWAAIPGYLGAAVLFAALGPARDFTREVAEANPA